MIDSVTQKDDKLTMDLKSFEQYTALFLYSVIKFFNFSYFIISYYVNFVRFKGIFKWEGNNPESTKTCTTPDPGHYMGKWQKHKKLLHTRAKRLALSKQVTTRLQWTDQKAWQTQNINNNDPQKKHPLGTVSKNIFTRGFKLVSWYQPRPYFRCGSRWIDVWFAWRSLTYRYIIY